ESPHAIVADDGTIALRGLVAAARGRCVAAHFGTYDYTARVGIVAAHQRMGHPACGFAKQWMLAGLADTGGWLADGPSNVLPSPTHRRGAWPLASEAAAENKRAVVGAWKLHYENIVRSLEGGFYQSWDLHPAQLPVRYAASYAFFLEHAPDAGARLSNFVE